jgi:hypothetical protein
LKLINDTFESSEEDERASFTMRSVWRRTSFYEEGEELRPRPLGDLNGGNGRDNTRRGMSDDFADK